jgi:ribosomal protein L30E
MPIVNYDEMHTIFSFVLATGKYTMGSNEALGTPPVALSADT